MSNYNLQMAYLFYVCFCPVLALFFFAFLFHAAIVVAHYICHVTCFDFNSILPFYTDIRRAWSWRDKKSHKRLRS